MQHGFNKKGSLLGSLPLRELIIELQASSYVHTHQFLNEKLGRVGDRHLHDAPRRLAPLTPVQIAHEAALLADVNLMAIGGDHETLEKQLAGSVGDKTITVMSTLRAQKGPSHFKTARSSLSNLRCERTCEVANTKQARPRQYLVVPDFHSS